MRGSWDGGEGGWDKKSGTLTISKPRSAAQLNGMDT